ELGVPALLEVEVERVPAFVARGRQCEHTQIDAACAAGQSLRVAGDCRQAVDRLRSGGDRGRKSLGEEARLIGGYDFGDSAAEVDRVDKRRAEVFHVGEGLVANADTVAVGQGRLDHEVAHD